MRINIYSDLIRYVCDHLSAYDAKQYDMTHNELEDHVLENLRIFLINKGFIYGKDLPEISNQEWHEIVEN